MQHAEGIVRVLVKGCGFKPQGIDTSTSSSATTTKDSRPQALKPLNPQLI